MSTPCRSLQYVQDRVRPGDTVLLAAGVYPIKNATFGVHDVTYRRTGPGEARITLRADSDGIQVGGDVVTLRDLTITSPSGTIEADTYGPTVSGADLTLGDVLVTHLSRGIVGGDGITVRDSMFVDVANVVPLRRDDHLGHQRRGLGHESVAAHRRDQRALR